MVVGNSQSFVGNILGSTGVFDGDVEVYAIPSKYANEIDVVVDPPINTSIGVLILNVGNLNITGYLINVTSSKPVNVTIGVRYYGLKVLTNASAIMNVTALYMNSTKAIANSTKAVLDPSKATVVNATGLAEGRLSVYYMNLTSAYQPPPVTVVKHTASTTQNTGSSSVYSLLLSPIVLLGILAVVIEVGVITVLVLLKRRGVISNRNT